MTDEMELTPVVKAWLKETFPSVSESSDVFDTVSKKVPTMRQQRHPWPPLPIGRGRAARPTIPRTDYQPTPIPVSNGQSATVTRSTNSMFSPAKAITAGAIVALFGGFVLIAQPFDQQGASVPGAATDEGRPAIEQVTGQFVSVVLVPGPERYGTSPDGNFYYYRNEMAAGAVEMSDERLSGKVTITQNIDFAMSDGVRVDDGPTVSWGTVSIENDAGAWAGTRTHFNLGVEQPTVEFIELVGSEAYEGWSAILYTPSVYHHDVADRNLVYGAVFSGNLPPDRESYLPE